MLEVRRSQIENEVATLMAQPPVVYRTQPPGFREVDVVPLADNAAFNVLSDRMTVDLRGWKDVPSEKLGDYVSAVGMTRRVQLRKVTPADRFEVQGRTSGLDLCWTCLDPFPFTVLAQKGDSFVGNDRMKIRKISINVSAVPVGEEFSLRHAATYWNSLQTEPEQWFGMIGYKHSVVASMLIVFPTDKPYKEYELNVSRTVKDKPLPYAGRRIVLTGRARDWIYWEVPTPDEAHVYRLQWKW